MHMAGCMCAGLFVRILERMTALRLQSSLVPVTNACECCHLANAYKTKERYTYSNTYIHKTKCLYIDFKTI